MKTLNCINIMSLSFFMAASVYANIEFVSYDAEAIQYNKKHMGQKKLAFDKLKMLADTALESTVDPVTNKTLFPASGNKNDYFSFGPYWWPNPDTENGLPYIRRDGEYNQATKSAATDKQRFIRFTKDVVNLGLAYYFTDDERYALKAITQLNAWFVNPETMMNPHLEHAQAIPGIVDGRGIGIIESRLLIPVLDSINILKGKMEQEQYDAIIKWFDEFNTWLLTSNHGFEEDNWHNNHGTWYDAQVVAFSMFVGKNDIAKKRLRITQMRRIGGQFDSEGKQHGELERTRPWHYSNFNLEAYNYLGHFGQRLNVDVWNYEVDKHSLENGYRFIANYINENNEWPYKELKGFDPNIAYKNILYANYAYGTESFNKALFELKLNKENEIKIENLLFN
ncbi:alginate lyase family protein [Vibrio aestuarianus]|uniref:alginate lyase family protein n=2 Tax=Vibrio aestuarianus TaxID=28171 RepID=UPI00237CC181|nr:alginate lyase family protein [Vibrio aestuarianus]MDE1250695.1 alginate lyase family protein [Vibrio aestuarianus]